MITNIILLVILLVAFLATFLLMPYWIRKAKQIGLMWENMNQLKAPTMAGSGGIAVLAGFLAGVMFYIAFRVFILKETSFLIEILALITVVIIASVIGLVDDLFGWRKGGLSRRSRIILLAFAAVPLMVINAGKSAISLPIIGQVDIGIIYPLIFIPIGIIGATATYNFLAGFNGLEGSLGVLILSALSLVSWFTGNPWLSIISLVMVLSVLAFLFYNLFPAKVLPGDVMTYAVGSLIAVVAILGNFEKIAMFFFIPVIIEFFLKARGKFVKHSFGKPLKDGSLDLKYDKIYGLSHLSILLMKKFNIKPTEPKVTLSIVIFQILIIAIGFILFREGIFIN
ncbi:MAG: hypothetical protein AABW80_04390 [Nanoarchaeota archaeon]